MPDGMTVMTEGRKLLVGVVTGVHGVRGLVRVKSFTGVPEDLTAYGDLTDRTGRTAYALELKGAAKGHLLVRIDGVDDRNAAEALKGTELYIDRDRLPAVEDENEFYHADLIGLACVDRDGMPMGAVKALFDFGAGDTVEIQGPDGKSFFLPFTRDAVPEIDLDAGRMVIDPPPEVEAGPDEDAGEAGR